MESLGVDPSAKHIEDAAADCVARAIAAIETEAGEVPAPTKEFMRDFCADFFKMGVWYAMRTFDCYPKV